MEYLSDLYENEDGTLSVEWDGDLGKHWVSYDSHADFENAYVNREKENVFSAIAHKDYFIFGIRAWVNFKLKKLLPLNRFASSKKFREDLNSMNTSYMIWEDLKALSYLGYTKNIVFMEIIKPMIDDHNKTVERNQKNTHTLGDIARIIRK